MSTRVAADPDELFAFIADTRNDPVWCPNVSEVSQTQGSGVARGAKFRFEQTVETRGRALQSEVEVEIVELGDRSIVWRVEDRFQIREISLKVVEEGDHAVVTQTTKAMFKRKPGMARWVYPLLARRVFKDQFTHLASRFS